MYGYVWICPYKFVHLYHKVLEIVIITTKRMSDKKHRIEIDTEALKHLNTFKSRHNFRNQSEAVIEMSKRAQTRNPEPQSWSDFFDENYNYFIDGTDEACTIDDDYGHEGFYRPAKGKNLIGENRKIDPFRDDSIKVLSTHKYHVELDFNDNSLVFEPKDAVKFVSSWLKSE